jgi:cell division protein FtsB
LLQQKRYILTGTEDEPKTRSSEPFGRDEMANRTALATPLLASALTAVGMGIGASQAAAEDTRAALEQQLKEQQARNEALRQQVAKIEALLKSGVCKDPAAAEAAQKETQALLNAKEPPAPRQP